MTSSSSSRLKGQSQRESGFGNTYYIAVTNPMPCTIGKEIAGVVEPLGTRLAFAENAVRLSVVKDIPLRRLATISTLGGFVLRPQLCCRENQRLNPDRIDIVFYRVRTCIGSVGPLICIVVCNAETVRERISTALAPKKRVRLCPNRVCLVAQKKVRIKPICLGGALVCL